MRPRLTEYSLGLNTTPEIKISQIPNLTPRAKQFTPRIKQFTPTIQPRIQIQPTISKKTTSWKQIITKYNYSNTLFNLCLFAIILLIITITLIYRFKNKSSSIEKKQQIFNLNKHINDFIKQNNLEKGELNKQTKQKN